MFKALFINHYVNFIEKSLLKSKKKEYTISTFKLAVYRKMKDIKGVISTLFKKAQSAKVIPEKDYAPKRNSIQQSLKAIKSQMQLSNMIDAGKKINTEIESNQLIRDETKIPNVFSENIYPESKNEFKKTLVAILHSYSMRNLILFVIFSSVVAQIIDSPVTMKNDPIKEFVFAIELFNWLVYFLEFFLCIYAYGAFMGKSAFFRRSLWNWLDFFNLVISTLTIFLTSENAKVVYTLRVLRIVRLVHIIQMESKEFTVLLDSIGKAMPNILRLLMFYLLFLIFFSVFAVRYLSGTFYHCDADEYKTIGA